MEIKIYDGVLSPISGSTPFGFFDNDTSFQQDGPKITKQLVYRLGYPIMDVEMINEQFYACFEEAVLTYNEEVNKYSIRENILGLQGSTYSSTTNYNNQLITPNLGNIIAISKQYGTEAGSGGDVEIRKGWIRTTAQVQNYNLDTLWANQYESGSAIEIRKVFHQDKPASVRSYQPYYGSALDVGNVMSEFGFDNMSAGVNFIMMPVYDDLLKMQAIEFNDMVRRSAYSFYVRNNVLQLFPTPNKEFIVWFEYILTKDRNNPIRTNTNLSGSLSQEALDEKFVTDISNVPYGVMEYANINMVGKTWIRNYTFAIVKEVLGAIRAKYQSIQSPDGDITLDGDTLRSEGIAMKEELLTVLRDTLEQSSRRARMEAQKDEAEYNQEILDKVPLGIYIG